jgi:hypothetical protein
MAQRKFGMFTIIEDKTWFRGFDTNIRFHWHTDPDGFRTVVDRMIEGVRVRHGHPHALLRVEAAYLKPGDVCIYDRYGNRIAESCIRRGAVLSEFVDVGRAKIKFPAKCLSIREPLLYLSGVSNHWGHFLTEGISRMWAPWEHAETRALRCLSHYPYPRSGSVAAYLSAVGLPPEQLLHFDKPIRIEQCFIPAPSFSNRAEAYSVHLRHSQLVALKSGHAESAIASSRPVYLSRSQLGAGSGRRIRAELELEQSLASLGASIVYPERLTLSEQITLFNTHRVFIGCVGSAFHGLSLALAPKKATLHVLCEILPNPNYLMFDAMLGCASNYVQALFATPGRSKIWGQDLTVDVEAVVRYVRSTGCL